MGPTGQETEHLPHLRASPCKEEKKNNLTVEKPGRHHPNQGVLTQSQSHRAPPDPREEHTTMPTGFRSETHSSNPVRTYPINPNRGTVYKITSLSSSKPARARKAKTD